MRSHHKVKVPPQPWSFWWSALELRLDGTKWALVFGLQNAAHSLSLFKVYLIDYAITAVPIFALCPPLPSTPLPPAITPLVHVHGSCI